MARITLKQTLTEKFKEFCQQSSLHGFHYFYSSSSWAIYAIWVFIIVSSVTLCGFLGDMILHKYIVNPTLTVVETTHYSMANSKFPAVTVCDTETVYAPKATNITSILQKRGYNLGEIREFYKSMAAVKLKGYDPPSYVTKMHMLLEDIGLPIITLADLLKKPCEVLIVSCQWRSKKYNCSDMFHGVLTVVGHCCQFNMTFFKSNIKDDDIAFVAGTHPSEGLEVVVDQRTIFPNGTVTDGYVLLYVYDEQETITLLNKYVTLTGSSFYDVDIDIWIIDSSEDVKSLPLKSRKCLLNFDKSFDADFYQECLSILILQEAVGRCHCLPFNYSAQELQVGAHIPCNWRQLLCVYQTIDKVTSEINVLNVNSECYERCDYVQYEIQVKYVKETNNIITHNKFHGRFVVHYNDNTCIKYRREVLYTWDQMLANLGGIFGLCVGGSIISIIEILWFVVDLLVTALWGVRRSRQTTAAKIRDFNPNIPFKYKSSKSKLAFVN